MKLSVQWGFVVLISLTGFYTCQGQTELVIYFTDPAYQNSPGQIVKVHLHHMNFTVLNLTNIPSPDSIDYDQQHEHLYWTDTQLKQIRRSGPDGENDTVVAQLNVNTSIPSGIALDSSAGFIFYADQGLKQIGKINMATLEKTIIVDTQLFKPKGIVAHTKNKKLFWVDWASDQKLRSCDYSGNNMAVIANTGAIKPHGIALDEFEGRLFWADGAGHVKSVLMDGTGLNTTYSENGVIFNDISVFNGFLYLTMFNYYFLVAMPTGGHHLSILHSKRFQFPNGIHAFSPNYTPAKVCDNYKYGPDCTQCGKCGGDHMCEKTTGICLVGCKAGYQEEMCTEACEDGTWGESCKNECGNCRMGTVCDIYTGVCPKGCADGHQGDKCDKPCGLNTYGNPCKDCGNCRGGDPCDPGTGKCSDGCLDGYSGDRCDMACTENTYGQCIACGYCADNAPCDRVTGMCAGGCAKGYEGERCQQAKASVVPGPSDLAVGLGVGIGMVVLFAIIGILIFFCIRKRRAGLPALPTVKMERSPGKEQTQENDYTTIETIGTTAIIGADELSEQREKEFQNETHSTA